MALANGMEIMYRLSQAIGEAEEGDLILISIDKTAKDGMQILLKPHRWLDRNGDEDSIEY